MKFDPKHQWGDWVYISMPDAPEELVAEAKRALSEQIDALIPTDMLHLGNLVWLVKPEYEVIDPETGERALVTCVAWKWTPKEVTRD